MSALMIEQWRKRYRLRASERDLLPTIDHTLQEVLDDYLPAALMELGIGDGEELCIRRVRIPLPYRRGRTATDIALDWSRLIAEAIRGELSRGSEEVLRFVSLRAALLDFAVAVASGDLSRAWAWNQLGLSLLPPSPSQAQAREQLLAALSRQPQTILTILGQLGQRRLLIPLLLRYSGAEIQTLWWAWMDHAGVERRWLEIPLAEEQAATAQPVHQHGPSPATEASGSLSASPVFGELQQRGDILALLPVCPRQWTLLLAMNVQPGLFLSPRQQIAHVLQRIEQWLPMTLVGEPGSSVRDHSLSVDGGAADTPLDHPHGQTESGVHQASPTPIAADSSSTGASSGGPNNATESATSPTADRHPRKATQDSHVDSDSSVQSSTATAPNLDQPSRRFQPESSAVAISAEFAGLFLLIPLMQRLDLVRRLLAEATLAGQPLAWLLWQLLSNLVDIPSQDPALKLFCGVAADQEWPFTPGDLAVNDHHHEVVQRYSEELLQGLLDCIPWELTAADTMQRLCRRSARLFDECAWLELHFRLRDVDTDIRRAGLDLDPDFVPWLGKVVKFRYD